MHLPENDSDTTELALIARIQGGDQEAFAILKKKYEALTTFLLARYYLRTFDRADWQQEAAEILYKAVLEFQEQRGHFSAFYKCKLKHHIYGRLRFYSAKRRQGDLNAVSLEALTEKSGERQYSAVQEEGSGYIVNQQELSKLLANFSHVELLAFEVMLGKQTAAAIEKRWGYSHEQLLRARNRARQKLNQIDLML